MNKIVCLDAGHGYNTPGKRIPFGEREWLLNNAVCNCTEAMLKDYKDVLVVRTDDRTGETDIPLVKRYQTANTIHPVILISVHHNSISNGNRFFNVTGIMTLVREGADENTIQIATDLAERMSDYTGLNNRGGALPCRLYIATNPGFPSVIAEGGFMDSDTDSKLLITESYQRAFAQAIVETIVKYFDLERKDTALKVEDTSKMREEVATCSEVCIESGTKVKIRKKATTYDGVRLKRSTFRHVYQIKEVDGDRVILSKGKKVIAAMKKEDLKNAKK